MFIGYWIIRSELLERKRSPRETLTPNDIRRKYIFIRDVAVERWTQHSNDDGVDDVVILPSMAQFKMTLTWHGLTTRTTLIRLRTIKYEALRCKLPKSTAINTLSPFNAALPFFIIKLLFPFSKPLTKLLGKTLPLSSFQLKSKFVQQKYRTTCRCLSGQTFYPFQPFFSSLICVLSSHHFADEYLKKTDTNPTRHRLLFGSN